MQRRVEKQLLFNKYNNLKGDKNMDILEVLNYFSEKYNFDEEDMSLIDEITNQIVNGEYDDDKYEDEDDKDIAEEDYEEDY